MNFKNCPRCGKAFSSSMEIVCPACVKKEAEMFERVYEYVKENPNCSISEVSEACEVSTKRILQYIREGRIEASSGMQDDVVCSQCGVPIRTGRMCGKCLSATSSKVSNMKETYKAQGSGFHTR